MKNKEDNILIINNEKVYENKGKYYCDNIDIKSIIEGLDNLHSINIICRGSALRYLLTRSYDYLNTPKNAIIKIKDPKEYFQKLNFHREIVSFNQYIK